VLGVFKYLGFFTAVARDVSGLPLWTINIVLPLGISFFTFHHIMYLVDLRAGKTKTFPLIHYALYIGFFPKSCPARWFAGTRSWINGRGRPLAPDRASGSRVGQFL
jgi:hypothetical protein